MISGHGTIDMAINALKIGAFDFIEKPFDSNILIMSITRAIEISELKRQNKELLKDNNLQVHFLVNQILHQILDLL